MEWGEEKAILKNRATQQVTTINNIEGFCTDPICRNVANDEDDPNHDYRQQITINQGGPR